MKDNNVILEVKDLHKSFGEQEVLKGISTEVNRGDVIAIIGPSGCGKSTFLRSLNLLETPTSGQILFEGTDLTDKSTDINVTRQKIGMVFQQFNLFANMTIKANIMLAPVKLGVMTKDEASKKADELLTRIGLLDKADAYPAQLSGGQKQRVAIIRSLAMNPDVILFDEPTSALDPEMVGEVLASVTNKILVAVIAFGLNSAAYVAEIVRSGIMSVDIGQFEAGRSLGLNYSQTMKLVIIPQAVKNILPALLNEFISLLKETSISGYIGMMDLTKGGDIIRSNTYEAFIPLIAVALIYLAIVMLLSHGVSKLERRLRSNER